jgi:hypothetical protein
VLRRYFFAPSTRALEAYWLCRTLAGSGNSDDPLPEYQEEYLKDDMGYTCWGTEHITVVAVSTLLWLAYAVGFPLSLAWVIRRDKAAAGERESADDVEASLPSSNGSEYWRSTRPMVEKFWFPQGVDQPALPAGLSRR